MNIVNKIDLELGNRDGDMIATQCDNGKFYLLATSETHCGDKNVIEGICVCTYHEISETLYEALKELEMQNK